ncbi:MAG: hypothetical protein JRC68_05320 [Deltaproteobacteria bacterium]|nr:hypothetical protein [Deltaproteobacteria bacterium]
MRTSKVREIIIPYKEDVQINPSVTLNDKIIYAIEVMLNNNVKDIAVVQNKRAIGMVRLEDAFKKIGLQIPRDK